METLLWIVIFLFIVFGWLGRWRERRRRHAAERALGYGEVQSPKPLELPDRNISVVL